MLDGLMSLTPLDWILVGASVLLILLPPRYDPAIRLKEWLERRRNDVD